MHLCGYGQDNYQQAVRDLAETFGIMETAESLAAHLAEATPRITSGLLRKKYQMPEPVGRTWPQVKKHLVETLKLPLSLIDQAHQDGLLFSDRFLNCVFPRANDSGVFKIGTGPKTFKQTLGRNGGPFIMDGVGDQIYVVSSPIDALTLKALHPNSTVLATGEDMPIDILKPYLEGREIYLAHGNSRLEKRMSDTLLKSFPKAQRLTPERGSSWNEYWKLQIEKEAKEKEREKAKAEAKLNAEKQAAARPPLKPEAAPIETASVASTGTLNAVPEKSTPMTATAPPTITTDKAAPESAAKDKPMAGTNRSIPKLPTDAATATPDKSSPKLPSVTKAITTEDKPQSKGLSR